MIIRLHCLATALLSATLSFCSLVVLAGSGEGGHALADAIAKAHNGGEHFTEAILFAPSSAPKHSDILNEETILQPLAGAVASLFATHPGAVSITVKTAGGKAYTLEMLRSYPTSDQPDMGVYDAAGKHASSYTPGLHYQGALVNDGHSLATMSVFANGDVMILFSNDEGNFVLGKLEDGSGKYILYNDKDMRMAMGLPCATGETPVSGKEDIIRSNAKTAKLQCNKVRIYWEASYTVYTTKGNLTNTQNYATALFNQFKAMYANEAIAVELSALYVWTTPDDYPTAASVNSGTVLGLFRSYWNSIGDNFNGDLAHLLAITGTNKGGVAYLDALCSPRNYSYAYSDIRGTYASVPTFSWDVEVVTHETGHNLGSNHTHWCGWKTGAGGTCGAIDDCYTIESSPGCSSCGSTLSNSAPSSSWKGTVMSYCHLVTRGINLANGFGAQPGAVIRSNVSNGSCLNPTMNATLTPSPICGGTGAVNLQFASNHFGTAPYTYLWTGGSAAQSLTNVTSPGTYSVQVTDSNGCSQQFSADVVQGVSSGNGITPTIQMPICCNNPAAPLILTAAVPQGLTSCHSVYWLRSEAPFASLAEVQAFLDTASALNAIPSTNESSIANNTTGASLNVTPEPCNSSMTVYYTPVAVQLPKAADSVVHQGAGSYVYTKGSTQIGAYVNLLDQITWVSQCDLLDTPTSRTLTATVSNYTGRANKLRLIVQDANNVVIYQSPGYAGNGTYSIPVSAITGNFLQPLTIIAMDYNCTTSTCVASSASLGFRRSAVYGARGKRMASDCALSPAIRVDFAPAGCTPLAVVPVALLSGVKLVPNPATSTVSIKFSLQQASQVQWMMNDMAGRTIMHGDGTYAVGSHEARLDLSQLARGVYFVNVSDGHGAVERLKLVIQ